MDQANVPTAKLSNLTDSLATNTAPSFAVGGIVTTGGLRAEGSYDYSVAVQADGKILLGGNGDFGDCDTQGSGGCQEHFLLARYNSDGSLDTGFSHNGIARFNESRSVAVQADGKILLSQLSNYYYPPLERYNSDGSPDLSFDGSGMVVSGIYGYLIALQADGKILLGGTDYSYNNADFGLARYNSDGSQDLSFAGDGVVTTDLDSNSDRSTSVTVQADGKILLGGMSRNTASDDFVLVRYNSDGSLDLSFDGGDGIVTTDLGSTLASAPSVAVQADGKILLGGTSEGDFALVRYNSDGSLDLSFDGGDGIVTTDLGSYSGDTASVAVQADGKILLGGPSGGNFVLVRYNADGSLDLSFNSNNLLSSTSYTENGGAVVLDGTVQIHDAELAAQGNYNGASITLMRQGGVNAEDVFSSSLFSGSDVILSGVTIGAVSNSNGTLSINFNSKASQTRVDAVLSSIAYRNTTDTPPVPTDRPVSVQIEIDWVFNDGNTGAQGIGEALTTTGSSIITILGNQDELRGTTGNDYLQSGYSKIYGFAGNDQLYGGRNTDILDAGKGNDTVSGGRGNDTVSGGRGDDTLDGGEGNDSLSGESGKDSMLGGLGDDLYSVDRVSDKVIEKPNEGTDTIISSSKVCNLPANVENLTLTGSHSIYGKGNDLANTLIGNDQDNRLTGGAGADTVSGGLGADIFKFNTVTETGITATTRDSIVDFSHDQGDKINLAAIDANTALKGNNAFASPTVGGAFSGNFANPGELYFDQSANVLYGNNDADSTADFSIKVMGVTSLAAADFVL